MVSTNILVLCVILGAGFSAAQTPCNTTCLYTDQLWGDVNPNLYNFCDPSTNSTVQLPCAPGRGFMSNGTYSGCVPFTDWPSACVNNQATQPSCVGGSELQPSETRNPNQYYLCPAQGQTPVVLTCINGGFLSTCGYLGCSEWSVWRTTKQCITY